MRTKTIVLLFVLVLLACVIAAGCSSRMQEQVSIDEGQSTSGGDSSLGAGVNLKDITATAQGETVVVEFSFIHGSRLLGEPEAKIGAAPAYQISVLPAPARVKVDLSIDYWDYTQQGVDTAGLLYGVFQSQTAAGEVSVYLQAGSPVSVSAREEEAKLVLTLQKLPGEPELNYFAALDAHTEYGQGLVSADLGLTPTLCGDYASVLLISGPFASEAEAQSLVARVNQSIAESIPNKQAYSVSLEENQLPPPPPPAAPSVVSSDPVFEPEQASNTADLPVLVENGRYLCTAPDGSIFYVRAFLPDAAQDEEYVLKEELWYIGKDGVHHQVDIRDFYSVERAAVSPDGRYLAILDAGMADKLLYVYNLQTGELRNLGEEGFGDNTASFVWDTRENALYAMTGYGTLQLTKYDFSLPEGERITSVEEKHGAESRIAFADGALYFADVAVGELGEIYRVDIETVEREQVAQGIDFALSPDGRYLVALVPAPGDEESVLHDLVLHDLNTGANTTLAEGVFVERGNYAFGPGSDVFYYTAATLGGESEEYPFAFLKCTITPDTEPPVFTETFLGYSKTGRFVPGSKENELYLIDYFMQNNYNFSVTYVFRDGE
ncbi:MAG TPA: hypothetical protein DEB31_07825 [Clostridiales bacterium]|nr:hypothetical protein [Clostridiales bacterium]